MTERQMVIDYLNTRVLSAWRRKEDEEARQCADFLGALEGMSDNEYEAQFQAPVDLGAIS